MKKRYMALLIGSCALLACGVQQKDRLAYVGSTLITQDDVDAFEAVTRFMPVRQDTFGLAKTDPVAALITTEAIFQRVRWNPANIGVLYGSEWKWKKRCYLSKMFGIEILQRNCGYTVAEVRNYYDMHRDEFRTITFPDSTGKPCTTQVVPPFDSVRSSVAEKLFLSNYKPDSTFMNLSDRRFFRMFRERGYAEYFMEKYYKEKFSRPFPDSIIDLYGKDNAIDAADMATCLSWVPVNQRDSYKKNPQMIMTWLIQWKLFSEKALAMGYATEPLVKNVLHWAWKLELAQRYVNTTLVPLARKGVYIDSIMALYSYADEGGNVGAVIDSTKWKNYYASLISRQVSMKFDSLIYRIRCACGVKFLQDTWMDAIAKDPAKLARQADSLRDAGNILQAQCDYNILTDYFIFTDEGKYALFELAKIQAESRIPTDAIRNYRRFLLRDADPGKRCEIMFRIGFLYDQKLNKLEMAEANYRWVLKNAPECTFAGDAEVMLRHLGEPMPSAEELREEVKRQGNKTGL